VEGEVSRFDGQDRNRDENRDEPTAAALSAACCLDQGFDIVDVRETGGRVTVIQVLLLRPL
jgi:hypothetical protein